MNWLTHAEDYNRARVLNNDESHASCFQKSTPMWSD